jgi:hypothetical protein
MAEKTILVCDTCGKPATESVTIKLERGNFVKDLCPAHVSEMIAGARRPRRGRPKSVAAGASAPRKSATRKSRSSSKSKTTSASKAGAKRRGRPRKTQSAKR